MSTNHRRQVISEALEHLDLGSKELETLLVLLESGRSTASELGKRLPKVSRTAVYDLLRSLQNRGLVSSVVEGETTYFTPEQIDHVVDRLEQEKRAVEEKQNALRSVADLYNQMRSGTAYQPGVRFFKGKEGIRAVHREVQNARKELLAIGDLSAVMRAFPGVHAEDNLKDFQVFGIQRRGLLAHNKEGEFYLQVAAPSKVNRVKWLPENVTVNTDTLIWEGHVAIIDYTDPINAVVIDNPTIHKTFVQWFEMMWGASGEEIKP